MTQLIESEATEPVAEAEAPNVPLATVESAVEDTDDSVDTDDTDSEDPSSGIAVTSNGHWTVVEQPPVTTRVTRRPSRRAASRPAGPPTSENTASDQAPQPEAAPDPQPADQHESAESQGEHTPV